MQGPRISSITSSLNTAPRSGHGERVLVVVLAETRAHEHTFRHFKRNLLDTYAADLALCVSNGPREDLSNPFYTHAKYVWTCEEPDDWGEAFDRAQVSLNTKADWRRLLEIRKQWLGGIGGENAQPGSGGILLYFRWFLKQMLVSEGMVEEYDRFIVTRSDFLHCTPAPPLQLLSPDKIWIPNGEAWGGITDRHLIASRQHVLPALSVADPILMRPDELYRQMAHASNWNLERYLKFAFRQLGLLREVRFFPYTMYLVRAVDGHTRWGQGVYHPNLGYCVKYRGEYRRAMLAKRLVGPLGRWTRPKMWLLLRGAEVLELLRRFKAGIRRLSPFTTQNVQAPAK